MAENASKRKKIIIAVTAAVLALVIAVISVFVVPGLFQEDTPVKKHRVKKKHTTNRIITVDDQERTEDPFGDDTDGDIDDYFSDVDFSEDDGDFEEFEEFNEDNFEDDEFAGFEEYEDTNDYDDIIEYSPEEVGFYFENFDGYSDLKSGDELTKWRVFSGGDNLYMYLDDSVSRSGKYSGRVAYASKGVGWGAMQTALLNEDWTEMDRFGLWLKGNGVSDRKGFVVRIITSKGEKDMDVGTVDADEWQYYSYDLRGDFGLNEAQLKCVTGILITIGGGTSLPIYIDDMGVYNSKEGSPAATPVTKLDFENTGAAVGGALSLGTVLESGNPMSVTLAEDGKNHSAKIQYTTTAQTAWTGTVIPVDTQNWQILSDMKLRIKTDGSRQLVKMGFYGKENLYEYTFYADAKEWVDLSVPWKKFKGTGPKNLADITAISLMFAAKEPGAYTVYVDDITAEYVTSVETNLIDDFEGYPAATGPKDNFTVDFGSGVEGGSGSSGNAVNQMILDFEDTSLYTKDRYVTAMAAKNSFNGTAAAQISRGKIANITFKSPVTVQGNVLAIDVCGLYRGEAITLTLMNDSETVAKQTAKIPDGNNTNLKLSAGSVYEDRNSVHTLFFPLEGVSGSTITKIRLYCETATGFNPTVDNLRVVKNESESGAFLDFGELSNIETLTNLTVVNDTDSFNGTTAVKWTNPTGNSSWVPQSDQYAGIFFRNDTAINGNHITLDISGASAKQYFKIMLVDAKGNVLDSVEEYTGNDPGRALETTTFTWQFNDLTTTEMTQVRGILIASVTGSGQYRPVIDNIRFSYGNSGEETLADMGEKLFDLSRWAKTAGYSPNIEANITPGSAHDGSYGAKFKVGTGNGSFAAYDITLPAPISIRNGNQISLWIRGDSFLPRQEFRLEVVSEYGVASSTNYDLKSNGQWKNVVFDFGDMGISSLIAGKVTGYRLVFKQYEESRIICVDSIKVITVQPMETLATDNLEDFETEGAEKKFSVHDAYADGITIGRTTAEKYSGKYSGKITVPAKNTANEYYADAGLTLNLMPHIDAIYSGNMFSFRIKGDGKKDTMKLKFIVECGKTAAESFWLDVDTKGAWVEISRSFMQLGLKDTQLEEIHGITFLVQMEDRERDFWLDDIRIDTVENTGSYMTDLLDEFSVKNPEYVSSTEILGTGAGYDLAVDASWLGHGNGCIVQGTAKAGETDSWYGIRRTFAYPFDLWGDGDFTKITAVCCTHAYDNNLKVRLTLYCEDSESYSVIYDQGESVSAAKFIPQFDLDDFGFTKEQFQKITGYSFEFKLDDTFQAVYFDHIIMEK